MDKWWVLALIALAFLLFIWTTKRQRPLREDPIDKILRRVMKETPLPKPSRTWNKVESRQTLELYDLNRRHLANAIVGLARARGNVDVDLPLDRFGSALRGFAYPVQAVSKWAQETSVPTQGGQRMLKALQDAKILDEEWKVRPTYEAWVVCAYTSPESFIHERVHTLWIQDRSFRQQLLQWWTRVTRGLTRTEKLDLVQKHNLRGGANRWKMLMHRGEETFIEEFMATYIEHLFNQGQL